MSAHKIKEVFKTAAVESHIFWAVYENGNIFGVVDGDIRIESPSWEALLIWTNGMVINHHNAAIIKLGEAGDIKQDILHIKNQFNFDMEINVKYQVKDGALVQWCSDELLLHRRI